MSVQHLHPMDQLIAPVMDARDSRACTKGSIHNLNDDLGVLRLHARTHSPSTPSSSINMTTTSFRESPAK